MGAARVGKSLGNFRILECLGSGGSGMIWKAEDVSLGRVVALKALRSELAREAEMARRFRDEARALAKLSHANIAALYSMIEDDDGLFLVLEYVEGNTLAALLATSGPLPLDSAFALFHQVLDGVGHAHEVGVVHRDLKPANLMVDARGRVKVMDFGIARVAGAARTTHHGKLVGTPEYMSPEQVRGEDATVRSDIYSLGILLFEMLTGRPPFRTAASFELMRAQIEEAPPDPCSLRPEIGPRIGAAILRALAKRPVERFATTRELQEALLDAGASRRGRTIAPVWRDLRPAPAASEAPTLAQLERSASAPLAPPDAVGGRSTDEAARAATRGAPSSRPGEALEGESDARTPGRSAAAAAGLRAKAPATVVLDVAQETARFDALQAGPLAEEARPRLGRGRSAAWPTARAGLRWALLTIGLIALAFGAVRSTRRVEAPGAESNAAAPTAPAAPRARPAAPGEPSTEPPAEAQPKREARPPAHAREAAPREPQKPRVPPASAPSSAPAPAAPEAPGWVIRR